jgi:hypothetical protein
MKASALFALLGSLSLVPIVLADLPDPITYHSAKADVVFVHPNKFKDIRDGYNPTDKGQKGQLDIFGHEILDRADDTLPAGYHLKMTFTDVDFAGDFEPWRGAEADEIRVIKDIYPPAYKFTWSVTNAAGQVVKQGNVDLRDMDFQMHRSLDNSSPIQSDKDEIDDWIRENLRHLGK